MAYEILNNAQITPHRLHALVRLVSRLEAPTRKDLIDLLQPPFLMATEGAQATQSAAEAVCDAALKCGLIEETSDQRKRVTCEYPANELESTDGFRAIMQRALLGVVDETEPNYLLNAFCAWYAVQGAKVLTMDPQALENGFIGDMYPGLTGTRPFNVTKYNGWEDWAIFLGWGWDMKIANRKPVFVPDATVRVHTLLPTLFEREGTVSVSSFIQTLAIRCPELDGGALYRKCWAATMQQPPGTTLSLMLSSALRSLHAVSAIRLVNLVDASDMWYLCPATGQALTRITHIDLPRSN
jgi:hypothetical protein